MSWGGSFVNVMALFPWADGMYKKLADASPYRIEPIAMADAPALQAVSPVSLPPRPRSAEPMIVDVARPEPVKSSSVPPDPESGRNSSLSPETLPQPSWEVLPFLLDGLVLAKGVVVAQQQSLGEESSDEENPSPDPETAEAAMGPDFRVLAHSSLLASDEPLARQARRKRPGQGRAVARPIGRAKTQQAKEKRSAGRQWKRRGAPRASAPSRSQAPRLLRSHAKRARQSQRLKQKRGKRRARNKASSDDSSSSDEKGEPDTGDALGKEGASDQEGASGKGGKSDSGAIPSSDDSSVGDDR